MSAMYSKRTRRLRRYLEKHGFMLVNRKSWRRVSELEKELREAYERAESHIATLNRQLDQARDRSMMDNLRQRVYELEAEVEAHKRIEAKLAERAITAATQ